MDANATTVTARVHVSRMGEVEQISGGGISSDLCKHNALTFQQWGSGH